MDDKLAWALNAGLFLALSIVLMKIGKKLA